MTDVRPLTDPGRYCLEKAFRHPLRVSDDGRRPAHPATLANLTVRGFLARTVGDEGPTWTITPAGRTILRQHQPRYLHAQPHRNYTTIPAQAARGEPEAVEDSYLARFGQEAEQQRTRTLVEQQAALDGRRMSVRLARAEAYAAANPGVDVSRQMAALARRLDDLERRQGRRARKPPRSAP